MDELFEKIQKLIAEKLEKDVSDIMVLAANEESILVKYQISMETQVEEADLL